MVFRVAVETFLRIDGAQCGAAFAYNVFFSVFPLMVLLVTISSLFIDRDRAAKEVIALVEGYIPITGEMQSQVFDTIGGVVKVRQKAGAVAFIILVWGALQCFTTLISAANRAWGTMEYTWWRLPLKSLAVLGITTSAVLLGLAAAVLLKMAEGRPVPGHESHSAVYSLEISLVTVVVVFLGLCLFYRLAPRRSTRFAEVWTAALCATILLRASDSLFVIYLKDFATLNALYGAFGGIMALLLWTYCSGCILIFGACLCAGRAGALSQAGKR
jgi:Ca2+-transporting ATPase